MYGKYFGKDESGVPVYINEDVARDILHNEEYIRSLHCANKCIRYARDIGITDRGWDTLVLCHPGATDHAHELDAHEASLHRDLWTTA